MNINQTKFLSLIALILMVQTIVLSSSVREARAESPVSFYKLVQSSLVSFFLFRGNTTQAMVRLPTNYETMTGEMKQKTLADLSESSRYPDNDLPDYTSYDFGENSGLDSFWKIEQRLQETTDVSAAEDLPLIFGKYGATASVSLNLIDGTSLPSLLRIANMVEDLSLPDGLRVLGLSLKIFPDRGDAINFNAVSKNLWSGPFWKASWGISQSLPENSLSQTLTDVIEFKPEVLVKAMYDANLLGSWIENPISYPSGAFVMTLSAAASYAYLGAVKNLLPNVLKNLTDDFTAFKNINFEDYFKILRILGTRSVRLASISRAESLKKAKEQTFGGKKLKWDILESRKLVFEPTEALKQISDLAPPQGKLDTRKALARIPAGEVIYNVYVDLGIRRKIGEIQLKSSFVSSKFGDEQLLFSPGLP